MSIVVQYNVPGTTTFGVPTAQDIINEVSQDIRSLLGASGSDAAILLTYVNRVQLDLCRVSRWDFLRSAPYSFVTHKERTDYWIGAIGGQYLGSVDTGLNLLDVDHIDEGDVMDRSNFRVLTLTESYPNLASVQYPDASARSGRPLEYRHERLTSPNILSIYPAPDNQGLFQMVPPSPICDTTVSGALPARTYYVKVSYVDSAGNESLASDSPTQIFVPANSVLHVQPPQTTVPVGAHLVSYSSYRVYASTVSGSETLQSTTISTSSYWTEPNTGLVVGSSLPTTNNLDPLEGYVIEFRYFKARPQVTSLVTSLLIPLDYKDVVIAGVNALASQFLKLPEDVEFWSSVYQKGIQGMIRDKNLFPRSGGDFIRPAS